MLRPENVQKERYLICTSFSTHVASEGIIEIMVSHVHGVHDDILENDITVLAIVGLFDWGLYNFDFGFLCRFVAGGLVSFVGFKLFFISFIDVTLNVHLNLHLFWFCILQKR